eukprot:g12458.t1
MMARDGGRVSVPPLFPLALAAVVLVGVVDAFLPVNPASSLYVNVKLFKHVPAVASAPAGGKLRPVISERDSRPPAAGSSMAMKTTKGARRPVPPSFSSAAAGDGSFANRMSRVLYGAAELRSLDDHDGGDQGGGMGKGGGSNGNGNGGDGDGDSSSAGDEGSSDGLDPLLLAGVGGLGAALDGLKEAVRNLRMPWTRKDISGEEGQEGDGEASSDSSMEKQLPEVLVADVVVDESVIPRDVLASAAVKSGLLGREASEARIQACAKILNQWYQYEGYILSGVSNAVISPNGTISFSVNEPVVSKAEPVHLLYYKPADTRDPASGLVQVEKGKTKAKTIARGLGLKGGEHFKVDADRWRGVLESGLFNGAQLSGAHQNAVDKGFTLDINVQERSSVVFEPGVTKTLFDSNWAGEICFEEKNVLGRNGVLGLDLRRSMASPFTSFSVRVGNNRFGQLGAWQASLFRDSISSTSASGLGRAAFGGGYANSAMGPAASAPVFSTASPRGVPRDIGLLARSISGAQHRRAMDAANAAPDGSNSQKAAAAAAAAGEGGSDGVMLGGGGATAATDHALSRCRGVSLTSSWPFSFVKATAGAGYQQVSPPTNLLKHGSHAAAATGVDEPDGAVGVDPENGGEGGRPLDVFTLSGGLSKDWRLPGVLRRLGGWGAGDRRRAPAGGGGGQGEGGSVSSFLDVKTGCLLEEGLAPRSFTQELATLVQRMPVGPQGKAGSWNATLNVRQQVQHCSKDTPLHQVTPFGGQRTVRGFAEGELGRAKAYALSTAEVRIPLKNFLGKLPAQAVLFLDLSAFRPVTWSRSAAAGGDYHRRHGGWETTGGPSGGGIEGDSLEDRHVEIQQQQHHHHHHQQQQQQQQDEPPLEGENPVAAVAGGEVVPSPPTALVSPPIAASQVTIPPAGEWRTSPPPSSSSSPSSPPPAAAPAAGGFRVGRGQGVGLRIADLIQVDLGISRSGMKQLHIGLVDRNF